MIYNMKHNVAVVVFPLVPVIAIISPLQNHEANSISLTTLIPLSRAVTSTAEFRWNARTSYN